MLPFKFTDTKVPLQLLDGPPFPQEFEDYSEVVAVTFEAQPTLASWGIDGWTFTLQGEITFSVTPIDAATGDALPAQTFTVSASGIPTKWDSRNGSQHQLQCTGIQLSFNREGVFDPTASCATFIS